MSEIPQDKISKEKLELMRKMGIPIIETDSRKIEKYITPPIPTERTRDED